MSRKMHQTTVRFGPDLWAALEEECRRLGVSVAQYLREAALTRLAYAAGRRGDQEFGRALDLVTGMEPDRRGGAQARELEAVAAPASHAGDTRERTRREAADVEAVRAEDLQAERHFASCTNMTDGAKPADGPRFLHEPSGTERA